MKKFVSFCVAVAVAASAVPVMAQCASCGGSPVFSQPVASSYVPQATYSAPQVYSSPVYSAPMASAPVYSQPMASTPMYSSPAYSQPMMSSGCNSCGGGMMSGGMVSDGGMMSSLPPGAQIISWEGGQQIQGTVVSDVLVEEGSESTMTEGSGTKSMMSEGANNVDVVEPPKAMEEDSPGPDSEETEGET